LTQNFLDNSPLEAGEDVISLLQFDAYWALVSGWTKFVHHPQNKIDSIIGRREPIILSHSEGVGFTVAIEIWIVERVIVGSRAPSTLEHRPSSTIAIKLGRRYIASARLRFAV
jgi:hypothetical protein